MTTTEPTTQASTWLEALVPTEVREEGARLLQELDEAVLGMAPLLARIGKHLAWDERYGSAQIDLAQEVVGARDIDVIDGVGHLISTMSNASRLHNRLEALGFDADEIARQHAPKGEE